MKFLRGFFSGFLIMSMACAWWMAGRPNNAPSDKIIVSHSRHDAAGASCSDCHGAIESATDLSHSFAPDEKACLTCHERDNCSTCHTQAELRTARQPKEHSLTFSHAAHMPRVGEKGCAACHSDAKTSDSSHVQVPNMDQCLTCHEHAQQYAAADCQSCHKSLRTLPLKAVAEFEHGADWLGRHGLAARSLGASCQQCHSQSTCTNCHTKNAITTPTRLFPEAVERNLIHRGDFATSHAIDARLDGDTCLRCHNADTCVSCHRAVGLAEDGTNPRNPHPRGYGVRGGGVSFHGDDARAHIETCAACHDQGAASNCVDCHRVGGIGGNPHPAGWQKRHDDPGKSTMCATCHTSR